VTDSSRHDRQIIPVVEEQAVVRKRKKLTEGVRVRTVVHEAQEVIDEPLATLQHSGTCSCRGQPPARLSNLLSGNSAESGSRILAFPIVVGLGVRGPFLVDLDVDGGDEALARLQSESRTA